jgi:hypothetical protein
MTTWYVRPDASHSATRDGKSYATAWGGWSAIVWSGTGVVAGDTLYVCGTHRSSSQLVVGNHASTASSKAIIRGDYAPDPGSLVFTGSAWLFIGRDHTTIQNITITAGTAYCIYLYGAPLIGTTIRGCTLNSKANLQIINIHSADNLAYVDLTIDGNSFNGDGGSVTGVGAAMQWLALASFTSARYLTRVTVTNNEFTRCSSNRAVIDLRIEEGAPESCKITDLIVSGNTFRDCFGAALVAYAGVFGRNTGIRITDNTIYNQLNKPAGMGGGFMIGGFGLSVTDGFGSNVIARNKAYRLAGTTGFSNPFYGTYTYYDNYAEDISTDTIDGCGILFDHGCDNCMAFRNQFKRIKGTGADNYYSGGFGILVLDATNIIAYGNLIDGCVHGVAFGNKEGGQSSDIFNNTFRNCSQSGAYMGGYAEVNNNRVRNNIFTATRRTIPSVRNVAATWTGEANNCFHGFGDPSRHNLHATSNTTDPQLDGNHRPWSAALVRKGIYLGGMDFNGKRFYNPPNIGAVDDVTATPRYLATEP